MPAIAFCLLAQITPTSILFDDLLKDFGWVYRRRVTIFCVLARKKLQPDNKTTNFHQLGRNTSEPRRNSSQPEKDCASQENVQPSQKTHRPANISMLAFLMRPHDFLQRCINAALYSQLFLFVSRTSPPCICLYQVMQFLLLGYLQAHCRSSGTSSCDSRTVIGVSNYSEQNLLAVVVNTELGSNSAAPKRTLQVDMDV